MEVGNSVVLVTFNGEKFSDEDVAPNENYWKLIGERGKVIEFGELRVLVQFNCDIDSFRLENHNPVKNSLWILESDLLLVNK
jgi:hypothetical protein